MGVYTIQPLSLAVRPVNVKITFAEVTPPSAFSYQLYHANITYHYPNPSIPTIGQHRVIPEL